MTNYTTNLKTWGDSGVEYPDGYSYAAEEPPVDEWDDYFNYNVEQDLQHLVALTNDRLDSGAAASYPTSPTAGEAVWRTDTQRLAVYDDTAAAFKPLAYQSEFDAHNHDSKYVLEAGDTMSGTLTLSDGSTAASQSWVNNSSSVPDADTVDGEHASAFADAVHSHALGDLSNVTASGEGSGGGLDADMVDGVEESALANQYDGVQHPVYATKSDVPSSITEGETVYVADENTLYVEDGS